MFAAPVTLVSVGPSRGRRNRAAFEQLCLDEYERLVTAVALIFGNRDVAADAVNEAFSRAWVEVRRGRDLESLGGWVRVVAINCARDHFRREKLHNKHSASMLATTRQNLEHASWGTAIDVRRALESLPERQRSVAVLHYLYDMTVNDIAVELGISSGTVKTTLQRARVALVTCLRESGEGIVNRDAS